MKFARLSTAHISSLLALVVMVPLLNLSDAQAEEWRDLSLGYRAGANFSEPFGKEDVHKNIFNLSYANGYDYGTNFFSADFLFADKNDPLHARSESGSQEAYFVYRHLLDIGKVTQQNLLLGPIRGVGITAGFDVNYKQDAGYNSRKRMVVAGPTLMMDVPGYLNISLLGLWESNAPYSEFTQIQTSRYNYKPHADLNVVWGIPVSQNIHFSGYADFIAAKGANEFGDDTVPETHVFMKLLYDLSEMANARKGHLKAGLGYEYWKNKFGNDASGAAGSGAFARTPMVCLEAHF
jgi:hypothetical protein